MALSDHHGAAIDEAPNNRRGLGRATACEDGGAGGRRQVDGRDVVLQRDGDTVQRAQVVAVGEQRRELGRALDRRLAGDAQIAVEQRVQLLDPAQRRLGELEG